MMATFHCEVGAVQRVAVIGAGVSGLAAIKSCLEGDLYPVCFERSSFIGGLWAPHSTNHGSGAFVYDSLVLNTCKEMSCYCDFPYPKSYPPYIRKAQHYDYLESYADHFGLKHFIRFNTSVIDVSPVSRPLEEGGPANQKWRVKVQNSSDPQGEVRAEIFDAVMICTGAYTDASQPEYPGQDKFMGRTIHSNKFRDGSDHANENVLVVGDRNSAGDIAVECSRYAKMVFLSTRNGTIVIPRFVNGGIPVDTYAFTLFASYMPGIIRGLVLMKLLSSLYNLKDVGLKPGRGSGRPGHMVNDEIVHRTLCGTIKPKPAVQELSVDGVVFSDGTVERVDSVIYATGYRSKFPFVDDKFLAGTYVGLLNQDVCLGPQYNTVQ